MLNVVSLYGTYPLDLRSTWAVPRLNAELLTLLAAAHHDWSVYAFSPAARPLPGVEVVGVELPPVASAKARLWGHRVGRHLHLPGARGRSRENPRKWLWADAGASQVRARVPDGPATIVICTHGEALLAARRSMPKSRIVHWVHTPVTRSSLDASVAADASVVPSVAVYRDSWQRLGSQYPAPTWVIPNWIDTEAFRPPSADGARAARAALGLEGDDMVIAFIGRHWIKGGQVVERALASLPSSGRRVVLLTAGEATRRDETLRPGLVVRGLGRIPPDDLVRVYEAADLGVVPSVSEENMPMAALEMMSCGLSVVASRVGGIPEVITDGQTGRLVDLPNIVEGWSEVIGELLADEGQRRALGEAARADILERFTPDRARDAWTHMLTGLAPAGRDTPARGPADQDSSNENC